MKPSARTIAALRIILDKKPGSAAQFAELFWPDNPMHRTVKSGGHGANVGKAAWLCGGSYLRRLEKAGLIDATYWPHTIRRSGWVLTLDGYIALRDWDEHKEKQP